MSKKDGKETHSFLLSDSIPLVIFIDFKTLNNTATQKKIRTYFLGSGLIALPVLRVMLNSAFIDLVGIGTQPDKAAGRKKRLMPTPVGEYAEENGRTIDKPDTVNSTDFLDKLRSLALDLIVVISFGQLLKTPILNLPEFGCLNIHASLLPKYRGASPINAAILNGDPKTGISFMKMDEGLDTGPVYESRDLLLNGSETAESLETSLGELAAEHVEQCIVKICCEGLQPVQQPEESVVYAKKIKKSDGEIDWNLPAIHLERFVRAYNPWPKAWFRLPSKNGEKRIQITEAEMIQPAEAASPGTVLQADKHGFVICCGKGALSVKRIVPAGKKEMCSDEFLRGCRLSSGAMLV